MTREFYADLQRAFPEWDESKKRGFRISPYNFEQFFISKLNAQGPLNREQIEKTANRELRGLKRNICIADMDEMYQGVGKTDVLIKFAPRGRRNQLHFMSIEQKEFEHEGYAKLLISLSWHGAYGLTPFQHERYLAFIKSYFSQIPFRRP